MPVRTLDNLQEYNDELVPINAPVSFEFMGDLVSSFYDQRQIDEDDRLARVTDTTQQVIEAARDAKPPTAPSRVVSAAEEFDEEFSVDELVFIGEDNEGVEELLPLTTELYKHFRGTDAIVRLDTPESYQNFRDSQPDISDEEAIEGVADLSRFQSEEDVPISLPPWAEGKVDCWRKGGMICCSIKIPGSDGEVRICTSATPIEKHMQEVVGYTHMVSGNVSELLGVIPTIAAMMGGGALIPKMAGAVPALLARPEVRRGETFIGKLVPANKPSLATLMALYQHVQSGDPQAIDEWKKIAALASARPSLAAAMRDAAGRLVAAQRRK